MNALLRIYPGDACILVIANALIGVTVILLVALLLVRIGGWSSGAWRYGVCLVGIVSVLVSPVLSYIVPTCGIALVTFQQHDMPASRVKVDRIPTAPLQRANGVLPSPRSRPVDEYREETLRQEVRLEGVSTLSIPDVMRVIAELTLLVWLLGIALLSAR